MVNEELIRASVMRGRASQIRALLLTSEQVKLVMKVEEGELSTTTEVAKYLNVSSQNASSKLNNLYKSGYIDRRSVDAKSGGYEYIYRSRL